MIPVHFQFPGTTRTKRTANLSQLFIYRTHLKNRILAQDRGGAEFQTGGILLYVEDLKRGTNKDIGPKDIFGMGSKQISYTPWIFNAPYRIGWVSHRLMPASV